VATKRDILESVKEGRTNGSRYHYQGCRGIRRLDLETVTVVFARGRERVVPRTYATVGGPKDRLTEGVADGNNSVGA
jgi:hypothetical protein